DLVPGCAQPREVAHQLQAASTIGAVELAFATHALVEEQVGQTIAVEVARHDLVPVLIERGVVGQQGDVAKPVRREELALTTSARIQKQVGARAAAELAR